MEIIERRGTEGERLKQWKSKTIHLLLLSSLPPSHHHPQLHHNSSPSLSPAPLHNHRISVFLCGSSGLDKLHYLTLMCFFLFPVSPPALISPASFSSQLCASFCESCVVFGAFFLKSNLSRWDLDLFAVACHHSLLQRSSFSEVQSCLHVI